MRSPCEGTQLGASIAYHARETVSEEPAPGFFEWWRRRLRNQSSKKLIS